MPKGKFEVQQKQLDGLPKHRPLILYVTAPVYPKDLTMATNQKKLFKPHPSLPEGVQQREGNQFNFCLIEANAAVEQLEMQLSSALNHYQEAAYKVVVLNAHGESRGVVLKDEGGRASPTREKVVLDGRQFAEIVSRRTHKHNLHVIVFSCHGHTFSNEFYTYVQTECTQDVTEVMAVTYFTSEATPTSWDKITTAGNGHVEVTRELGDFVKTNVEPNSPYRVLDTKIRPSCIIL